MSILDVAVVILPFIGYYLGHKDGYCKGWFARPPLPPSNEGFLRYENMTLRRRCEFLEAQNAALNHCYSLSLDEEVNTDAEV